MGTPILSEENDKGMVLAMGNVGKFLDLNQVNTYISIDGVNYKSLAILYKNDYTF